MNKSQKDITVVSMLSFVFGLTDAFFIYILSSYFGVIIGSDNVGGFYLVTYIAVFLLLWKLHSILRKIGGSVRAFFLFMTIAIAFSAVLSRLDPSWASALCLIALLISTNLAWVSLDVIIEEHSEDSGTGAVRGLHLTIVNAGFVLAPLFSTRVLDLYGYEGIFSGVTIGYALLLGPSSVFLKASEKAIKNARMDAFDAWKKMLKDRDLLSIYAISFALEFFYVVMIIYTPMHLRALGLSWENIGTIFTIMLLPFVLLQYPLGVLADKRFGEKEFLIIAITLCAVSSIALGVTQIASVGLLALILFISRVGAAAIEVLRDAYFYKQIDGDDDDLISFFRTSRPMANIIGATIAIPFLSVFSLHAIFFLGAIVLALSLIPAFFLNDTETFE